MIKLHVAWKNDTFTVTALDVKCKKKAEMESHHDPDAMRPKMMDLLESWRKKVYIYYFGSIINDHSLGGSHRVPDAMRLTITCFSIFHHEHIFF